jgi:hypothetical protein
MSMEPLPIGETPTYNIESSPLRVLSPGREKSPLPSPGRGRSSLPIADDISPVRSPIRNSVYPVVLYSHMPSSKSRTPRQGNRSMPILPKNQNKFYTLPILPQSPPKTMIFPMTPEELRVAPGTPQFAMHIPARPIQMITVKPIGGLPASPTVPAPVVQQNIIPLTIPQPIGGVTSDALGLIPLSASIKPNYAAMSAEQQADVYSMFRGRFGILKLSYKNWNIQIPDESMSLDKIHDLYAQQVKEIMISTNANSYRKYIIVGFLGLEFFAIKVLGLDMAGFTESQFQSMQRYDQLLVELGEKYQNGGMASWPLEIRMIFAIFISAVIFVVLKLVGNFFPPMFMEQISKFVNAQAGAMNFSTTADVKKDEFGLPVIDMPAPAGNGGAGIMGMLGGLFNGGTAGVENAALSGLVAAGTTASRAMTAKEEPAAQPRRKIVYQEDD